MCCFNCKHTIAVTYEDTQQISHMLKLMIIYISMHTKTQQYKQQKLVYYDYYTIQKKTCRALELNMWY